MGWQENQVVRDLLATTHVFLTPSVTASNGETEGIPNAVKEAMAVGVPVVSTFHGGIPELVEDGVSGPLVAERDAQGLADKIAQVIDNPAACETMRVAARAHIEKEYEIEAMTDRLLHLYSNL